MTRGRIVLGLILSVLVAGMILPQAMAADEGTGFSLQVTPSPLVATIEPGQKSTLELRIRNGNTVPERLKMELRTFNVDKTSGQINIEKEVPKDVENFVTFGEEVFDVDAGEWFTQQVYVNTPKDAGFSYSFAILISREKPAQNSEGASSIEGSVAVFTLLNVNRPDAKKELQLASFTSTKKVYEYMPATFQMAIENTGNTIVQPKGNIFIGRSGDENQPLEVLEINPNGGYIIPSTMRILESKWNEGFPSRNEKNELEWDWSKLKDVRIGRYTAKAVLIYDDGQRDIPIESAVTFWLIPWKILLVFVLLVALILVGLYTILRRTFGLFGRKKPAKPDSVDTKEE